MAVAVARAEVVTTVDKVGRMRSEIALHTFVMALNLSKIKIIIRTLIAGHGKSRREEGRDEGSRSRGRHHSSRFSPTFCFSVVPSHQFQYI